MFRVFFDEPSNVIVRKNNEILMNFNKHTAINKSHPEEGNVYNETPAGRRLNPNIEAIIENHSLSKKRVVIKTNSIGYRNAEILPKTEKLRILFLGDSIIFGDYLNEEETIVKLTEIYLKNKDIQNETINAGIGSTGLANYLTVLTESGLKLQPNIVLICFYLNDFEQSPGVKMINPPKYLNWSWLGRLIYRNISILKSNYKNHNNISNRKIKICFEELKKQYNNPQKEFHKFFQNYSHIHIHNDSIGGEWGSCDTASSTIECPTDVYIDVSNDDFKKAQKCYNTYHNLCSEKQGYISDVSDALLTLKSESRIKEAFPEALPYLNFTDAMLPSPKYEKLRLLLK
ncbi:MAG TPA: hypothetical protein PLJ38_06940 [bacterium]|nr:hypothetical protein [bacterium]